MSTKGPDVPDVIQLDHVTSSTSIEDSESEKRNLPLIQSCKIYPKVVGYCFGLTTVVLLWGYDLVIVGTIQALPVFQRDYGILHDDDWIIPAMWLALWSAFTPLGAVLGAVAGGWFQDRVGRRMCLAMGSAISVIGVAIIFVSNLPDGKDSRRGTFLAGKTVQGFAIGIVVVQSQTYVSEIVPTSLRGPALALFPTFTLLGQLLGAIIIYASSNYDSARSYLTAFGSQWAFSIPPLILAIFMPESPAYLVRKKKMDKAMASIKRLHTAKVDHSQILETIRISIEAEEQLAKQISYRDCFNKANLRRTLIVIWANIIPTLFGLPLLANASYFIQTIGMSANSSLIFLILGIILGMLANAVSVWVLSRVGRRRISVITLSLCAALWTAMGIAGIWNNTITIW
jgi:MFS transporter, SP family, general alpha glucoside:H+ symporter